MNTTRRTHSDPLYIELSLGRWTFSARQTSTVFLPCRSFVFFFFLKNRVFRKWMTPRGILVVGWIRQDLTYPFKRTSSGHTFRMTNNLITVGPQNVFLCKSWLWLLRSHKSYNMMFLFCPVLRLHILQREGGYWRIEPITRGGTMSRKTR